MLSDKEVNGLIDSITNYLSQGIAQGVQEQSPSQDLLSHLEHSAAVFSGFKTFHEMKEASAMLLDDNGNIKPFNQYLNDVKKVNETYNHNYLRTEYDLVVNSANAAATWEDAQNDDGGRYVLQYRTAGDNKVREEHAKLNGTTLPVSDPFWDLFYPPNGWNCRCKAQKVRASKYPLSDSQQAIEIAAHATNTKSGKMFRFNPGKQKSLFPKHNSYTIAKCSTCDKNIKLAKVPSNELCAACPIIQQCADYTRIPTNKGVLRIHNTHGKNEKASNIKIASYFAEKYEHEIDLLPNENNKISADSINHSLKKVIEYKEISSPTKSAIDNAIRKGNKQANHIVLWLNKDMATGDLKNAVSDRVRRTNNIESITIVQNGKDKTYSRDEMLSEGFKIQLD